MGDYGRSLRFGVMVNSDARGYEEASALVRRANEAGLDLVGVPDHPYSRGQMAVLVKPNGLFGTTYMAAIKPLRYLIVYPALMRQIEREWRAPAIRWSREARNEGRPGRDPLPASRGLTISPIEVRGGAR